MPDRNARAVYAATIVALAPYLPDIVFIGGWVQALYLAHAGSPRRPVSTTDIDITLPDRIPIGDREPMTACIARAGFEADDFGAEDGTVTYVHHGSVHADVRERITLDLITAFDDPREARPIEG